MKTLASELSPGQEKNNTLKWFFFSEIFQHNHIYQGLQKSAGPTLQCTVLFQSRGQGHKKMQNYETNLSPAFNNIQDLVPWIREQQYLEMLVGHFSIDPDINGYFVKLSKQHLYVWLFSKPVNKIIFYVDLLGCQDLRVELIFQALVSNDEKIKIYLS